MKKLLFMMITLLLSGFLLFSCTDTKGSVTESGSEKNSENAVESEKESLENESEGNVEVDVLIKLYLPNDNFDDCKLMEFEGAVPDGDTLISYLIKECVLSEDSKLLSMKQEEKTVYVDMNEGFLNHLCTFGSSTEAVVLKSLAYSFMENFGGNELYITVEGKTFSTGHAVYDFPIQMPK